MPRIRRKQSMESGQGNHILWKLGKYIRLSRDDGNSESESITNQRKILDEQIPGFFHDDYEIVNEYIDDGRTGTSDNTRPAFLRLIEDVKNGKINCIVTKNLSRAFRNSANQGKFLEEFIPLYSTRFISLYEPHIDTFLNPEAVHSLEVGITGFMNEQYAYKTSVDVRRTFDIKRKKGEFIGAFAPFGYTKNPRDKNSLIVDEEAAEIVRKIYRWFVEKGMSKSGIAKRLNELGIPNPASYKRLHGMKYHNPNSKKNDGFWCGKTIRDILTNEMYIGNMVQGKQKVISYKVHERVGIAEKDWYIVENTHEAIVSREAFFKAQMLHQKDMRTAPEALKVHLFSGLIRCADCNKAMTRKSSKQTTYYTCSTYTRKSKALCTKHTVREDLLAYAVLLAIQKQISLIENLTEMIDEIDRAPVMQKEFNQINHLLQARKQEVEKLITAADYLYMDWRTGEITQEEYRRMKLKCQEQMKQQQEAIANLNEEKRMIQAEKNADAPYLQTFLQHKNIDRLERGILVELIHAIYVHEGGGLTIEFNFTDPYRQALQFMGHNGSEK